MKMTRMTGQRTHPTVRSLLTMTMTITEKNVNKSCSLNVNKLNIDEID